MKATKQGSRIVLSLLVVAGLFLSCRKSKSTVCSKSMTGLAGTYRLTALTYKSDANTPEEDLFQALDACQKDDLLTLQANGTYIYQDAGVQCDPVGNDEGDWSVSGGVLSSDGEVGGVITSYDCHTLKYYVADFLVDGDKMYYTLTKQ
jgi:hypothetical protein